VYIHVMYMRDREKFIAKVRNKIEKKLLEILR
jgi:multisubunit Na+/H+ antiporter MnhE subunit